MDREVKEEFKKNFAVMLYAIIIILAIILGNWGLVSSGNVELVVVLMSFFILADSITQVVKHESEETRKKVQYAIALIVAAILVSAILFIFFL